MPNWKDLASEIKLMVINQIDIDEYDLLDFRLANKQCNELSKKLFAERYFTVRRHFVNKKSLQALVDISEDAFFAQYVKTIQLSALQGRYDVPSSGSDRETVERHPGTVSDHITFNGYHGLPELKALLRKALLNLKTQPTQFTIGIDRLWRPFEDVSDLGDYGRFAPAHYNLGTFYLTATKWANVAENERIAFEMITSIAREVKLPVKGLKVSLYDHYMLLVEEGKEEWLDYNYREPPEEPCDPELLGDIYSYLAKSSRMDVDIDLTTGDYRDDEAMNADNWDWIHRCRDEDPPYQSMKVIYEARSKTLTINKTDTRDAVEFMAPWLSSMQIKSLRLTNMYIKQEEFMAWLVEGHKSTIKKLRMADCTLENDWAWRRAVFSTSHMSSLEYLSFTNPSVKHNRKEFFNSYFDNEKKLVYSGNVQEHLSNDLEPYDEYAMDVHGQDEVEEDSEQEE